MEVDDAPKFLAQPFQSVGGVPRREEGVQIICLLKSMQNNLELKKDAAEMRLERADKGGSAVYISRKMWKRLEREHVALCC